MDTLFNETFRWELRRYAMGSRWHLYAGEVETPFFLDMAGAQERRMWSAPIALCAAGLCPYRGHAATLAGYHRVDAAKAKAERLWREWTESGEMERRAAAGERARRAFYARHQRGDDGEPMENAA